MKHSLRVVEFRTVMPFCKEEFKAGFRFIFSNEMIEIASNGTSDCISLSNVDGGFKLMNIGAAKKHMPKWIRSLFGPNRGLQEEEMVSNYPKIKYKSFMSSELAKLSIDVYGRVCKFGNRLDLKQNANELSEASLKRREVEYLDICNSESSVSLTRDEAKKSHFGPILPENNVEMNADLPSWVRNWGGNLVMCYITVIVRAEHDIFASEICKHVIRVELRESILNFLKKIVNSIDDWCNLPELKLDGLEDSWKYLISSADPSEQPCNSGEEPPKIMQKFGN